jgi:hypothetical protein
VLYLGMEVDKAIEVAEQSVEAIPAAADMVGADDFAADPGAAEARFCIVGPGAKFGAPGDIIGV